MIIISPVGVTDEGVNRPTMFFVLTISQIIFVKGPLESNSIPLMHYLEGIAQEKKTNDLSACRSLWQDYNTTLIP